MDHRLSVKCETIKFLEDVGRNLHKIQFLREKKIDEMDFREKIRGETLPIKWYSYSKMLSITCH